MVVGVRGGDRQSRGKWMSGQHLPRFKVFE
jgi:hypothetical protein